MYLLITSSIDDPREFSVHGTREDAIEAAVQWFLSGYDVSQTFPILPDNLDEYVDMIREDLAAGREFTCNMFYEKIKILEETVL